MPENPEDILPISVEEEMRRSYLDYAMSVIVGRALPDVRDGLKPVHRRILYAMHELGNAWGRPHKKSARVVGDVIGKYHPHGESAVYDALVRMAQDFSMRYVLVDGQGNFGSVDGDPPAAMRYTEVRMAKIAQEMLSDIDMDTVDWVPNYDGAENEPLVLPSRLPNLLVNGSSGIAVGMATNIPPHNLKEIVSALRLLLKKPDSPLAEIISLVPAPDFPTGGIIWGVAGVEDAYRTGRGKVVIRSKTHFEPLEGGKRSAIVVDEIPYQVNKSQLLAHIGELVKEKRLEGISELRDESDKSGMRIVVELRRGEDASALLSKLLAMTALQNAFAINIVALDGGQPRLLNLKECLLLFLRHRREVVWRRTEFELKALTDRAHILEGLALAAANLDEMIALIRQSQNAAQAKKSLMGKAWSSAVVARLLGVAPEELFFLSEAQAQAILEMRLQRLTALEQDSILEEYQETLLKIKELKAILASPEKLSQVIDEELAALAQGFGDARKSEVVENPEDESLEEQIPLYEALVTLTQEGYIKAQPLREFEAQKRGGRGKIATTTKDGDFVKSMQVASSKDMLLFFSSKGRAYWQKVHALPQGASRMAKGKPLSAILGLEGEERIEAMLALGKGGGYVLLATALGMVKKTPVEEFSRPRTGGVNAIDLTPQDQVVDAKLTSGQDQVLLISDAGKALLFSEEEIRSTGRGAMGVRGIRLGEGHRLITLLVADSSRPDVLLITENGFGKRTQMSEFTPHGRATQGIIAMGGSERNGRLVGAVLVGEEDEAMLLTSKGKTIRMRVQEIRKAGRGAQGVRLIRLEPPEKLVAVERVLENAKLSPGEENDGL